MLCSCANVVKETGQEVRLKEGTKMREMRLYDSVACRCQYTAPLCLYEVNSSHFVGRGFSKTVKERTVSPDSHAVIKSPLWQRGLRILENLPGYLGVGHFHSIKVQLGVLVLVDLLEGLGMTSRDGCPSIAIGYSVGFDT